MLGHIGYSVTPWNRRRGYATAALRELLPQLPALGLPYVEITTDVDNTASQKGITVHGGVLVERFTEPAAYGTSWRSSLTPNNVGDRSGIVNRDMACCCLCSATGSLAAGARLIFDSAQSAHWFGSGGGAAAGSAAGAPLGCITVIDTRWSE